MRETNAPFYSNYTGTEIFGTVGKHGEVVEATIYKRDRPIVSIASDMHRLHDYDGLMAFNVQGELAQIAGLYYHGDIYPLSRKTLGELIVRMVHSAVCKGRAIRKNIFRLRSYTTEDRITRINDGEVDLIRLHMGNVLLHRDLEQPAFGKDSTYMKTQCRIIVEVLNRKGKPAVVYSRKTRLESKHTDLTPLVLRLDA